MSRSNKIHYLACWVTRERDKVKGIRKPEYNLGDSFAAQLCRAQCPS